MSTITDAVEKKKKEDEAKRPKELDIEHPPRVFIPRDKRRQKRFIAFIALLFLISTGTGVTYYYRQAVKDYFASYFIQNSQKETQSEPVNDRKNNGDEAVVKHAKETSTEIDNDSSKSHEVSGKEEFPRLSVTGIIFDPFDPEAIINGQSVKTGEEIEGAYIVEIMKDGVRVRYKGEERILRNR